MRCCLKIDVLMLKKFDDGMIQTCLVGEECN